MDIRVYNANQIGGCFTVITTETARIMIDYGQALPGSNSVQEEFDWEKNKVDAVFITHYHGDHVGRIAEIPDNIDIYMGRTAKQIMLNIHEALAKVPKLQAKQQEMIDLLGSSRVKVVEEDTAIDIKGISVTPYSVDHSAYDAYMYLVEAEGKTLLHTGDFRGHGYRGEMVLEKINQYVHKDGRKIDYLVTEGTMMGDRQYEKVMSEAQLQKKATGIFAENKYVFLIVSSTNLDSLASFYHAADVNDMHTYCYSFYLYNQLKTFTETAGKEDVHYRFDNIHTVNLDGKLPHELWEKPKTQEELMREHGFLCIVKPGAQAAEWMERFQDLNPLVVYSMWNGYINPKFEAKNQEWIDFFAPYQKQKRFEQLHTSGHATAEMIEQVITAVAPQEEIIPMHTENAEGFASLNIDDKYKKMCRIESGKLSEDALAILEAMKDHRYVSEDLFREFKEGGLKEFRRFVLEHNRTAARQDKLAVLLRGNGNRIIIYYHNHVLWELSWVKQKCRVEFNFNHARYTRDWEKDFECLTDKKTMGFVWAEDSPRKKKERLESLPAMVITRNEQNEIVGAGIGVLKSDKKSFSYDFVKKSFEIIHELIDNFFDSGREHSTDYFCKRVMDELQVEIKEEEEATSPLIEKRWQQRLFFEYKELREGLYIYDLEFSQPFPTQKDDVKPYAEKHELVYEDIKDKINATEMKKVLKTNSPDMLGLRFNKNGEPVALVMVEVKSTESACLGSSGIAKHLRGMAAYCKQSVFLRNRRTDAYESMKQYREFGFISEKDKIPEIPENLPVEMILLLTNNKLPEEEANELDESKKSALDYYKGNKEYVDKIAQYFNCQIWITESNYFDNEIKMEVVL